MNQETADVISTYVYRIGITSAQYSYSSAIGFFNSIVSITLLLSANFVARRIGETSLF
jgi:putative aldouronate transport system permease protein